MDVPRLRKFAPEADPGLSSSKVAVHPSLQARWEGGVVQVFKEFVVGNHVKSFAEIKFY